MHLFFNKMLYNKESKPLNLDMENLVMLRHQMLPFSKNGYRRKVPYTRFFSAQAQMLLSEIQNSLKLALP